MDHKNDKIDETIINSLLQSNDLKDIIKKLVQGEILNSGNQESAIQKLSEIFSYSTLHEGNAHLKPSKHSSIITINDLRSERVHYSNDEISLRCSMASLFRLIDMEGWAKSIYNLITLRIPSDNNYYINPFGLLYHEITASSIIKINSNGNIIDNGSTILNINKRSWAMHESIYKARNDVNCIVQLSLPDVVAISSIKSGLLPVSLEAIKLLDISPNSISGGGVKYHVISYDNSGNEFQSLINDLGNSKILFLRNNSLLVCGSSIAEVWVLTKTVVTACQAQIRLIQLGGRDLLYSECNFTKTNTLFSDIHLELNHSGYQTDPSLDSELEFEAMMRLLDNAGYRTGHKYVHKLVNSEPKLAEPISSVSMNGDSVQCPFKIPNDNLENNGFVPDEFTIQICPMPYNNDEMNQAIANGDDSVQEHELAKGICAEVIDNSLKYCRQETNRKDETEEVTG